MTAVSRKEGFKYGFYLFSYWLVLLAFSVALFAAGAALVDAQYGGSFADNQERVLAGLGGFVSFLGVVVFGSGQVGLAYKLIADGSRAGAAEVGEGNASPSESSPDEEGTDPAGSQAVATQPAAQPPEPVAREPQRPETPGVAATEQGGAPAARDARTPPQTTGPDDSPDPAAAADGPHGPAQRADSANEPAPTDEPTTTGEPTPAGGTDPVEHRETAADPPEPGVEAGGAAEDGDPDAPGEPRESPEDVASESEIAEELGFGGGEGRAAERGETARPSGAASDAAGEGGSGSGPTAEEEGSVSGSDSEPATGADRSGAHSAEDLFGEADDGSGAGADTDPLAGGDASSDDPLAPSEEGDDTSEEGDDTSEEGDGDGWTTGTGHEDAEREGN